MTTYAEMIARFPSGPVHDALLRGKAIVDRDKVPVVEAAPATNEGMLNA